MFAFSLPLRTRKSGGKRDGRENLLHMHTRIPDFLTAQQLTVSLDAALHLYSMLLMLYFSVVSSMQDIIHQSCSVLGGKKLHLSVTVCSLFSDAVEKQLAV